MSIVTAHQKNRMPQGVQKSKKMLDADDGSISSAGSSSSSDSDSSKEFCADGTSETGHSTVRSMSAAGRSNWFDDQLSSSHSSYLVLGLVLTTAIVLGSVVYVIADKQSDNEFQSKFHDASEEITQVVQERSRSYTKSLHRLSLSVTDVASNGNADWPFYTVQNMGVFAQDLLDEDPAIILTYAPLVSQEHRGEWEAYSVKHQTQVTTDAIPANQYLSVLPRPNISESLYRFVGDHKVDEHKTAMGPFSPAWQVFPVPSGDNIGVVNLNLLSDEQIFARLAEASALTRSSVMSELREPQELLGIPIEENPGYHIGPKGDPQSLVVQPIFDSFEDEANIVGHLVASQPWQSIMGGIIQDGGSSLEINSVVSDSCTNRSYTYWINGSHTVFVSQGDLHETKYDNMNETFMLASYSLHVEATQGEGVWDQCVVGLSLYPTAVMQDSFESGAGVAYLLIVILMSVITIMAFMTHDKAVNQRQQELQLKTQRSNAIIASLFPPHVRDKLFGVDGEVNEDGVQLVNSGAQKHMDSMTKTDKGSSFLGFDDESFEQKQIADLFPNCTVMFADIAGFTAWSSTRDPNQVFELLETVFRSFDEISQRRRVFKVETVGDCYLCVSGLPKPRKDHAIAMARVARDCLEKFHQVTRMLEVSLGPETGDLGLRVGLHSGPITGGILRGGGGRFQLFGDTVNTCSRLETTGEANRIHISKETAEMIKESGKSSWVKPREEIVTAKGKGTLITFWLLPKSLVRSSVTAASTNNSSVGDSRMDSTDREIHLGMPISSKDQAEAKLNRLIFWVSESLLQSLRQIVALRNAKSKKSAHRGPARESVRELEQKMSRDKIVLGEVKEVITMPKLDEEAYSNQVDPKTIKLDSNVETQLREYVTVIASLYLANPFHSFQHASHVTMSIMKLLSRIVAPHNVLQDADSDMDNLAADLHDYTYGITSDPLTQFSVLLAAIVHDVDHRGVSNPDLCVENKILAKIFDGKSVAEQNSIDLAWQALMDPNFQDLRDCIYTDATELRRFRQLLVNCVLATDIFDPELSSLRKARWNKAFEVSDLDATKEDVDRKATIVIEHLIQASDVSHTMQHWQVYLKWNEHFFEEQYLAYLNGRSTSNKDPSKGWYKGEMWFFDNYVIPLAKKLKDCGVFGVSSEEYLNYAKMNREEWEKSGEDVVAGFVAKYGEKGSSSDAASCMTTTTVSTVAS